MQLTRRAFTGGALSAGLALQLPARARAERPAGIGPALAAIRAYAEEHRRRFDLPGLTLGLTAPDGFSTVLNFGFANREARSPIGPDTLFQIGSISKVMTALVIHQLAGEGRFALTDRVSALLPGLPLPAGNAVTVQHLLDHVAGLPSDAPLFPQGGLWTAYAPGEHWHYSNTAYDMLGKIAEHAARKPLAQAMRERIFAPLGMHRSRGAIIGDERLLYAQGYEPADRMAAYARGAPLGPAAWVDVTFGAGNVASTAEDMNRFMRSLADAAGGRGGLGLPPAVAKAFTEHAVRSDTPGMRYGNGLMHVTNAGRSYLHHTGGMVSFSSSFHLDTQSGIGAFASSTISAFAEYRPRLLTRFAVDALAAGFADKAPPAAPSAEVRLPNPSAYIGRYSGPAGTFEVRAGAPLMLVANGTSAALQPWGGEIFRTTHPAFRHFSLMFERKAGAVSGVAWGPAQYRRQGSAAPIAPSNPELAKLAGRFVNDNPWWGGMPVVERGGRLWIGTETPMSRIGDNLWRVGEERWSPERAAFADFLDGRPQTFILSGEKFVRHSL